METSAPHPGHVDGNCPHCFMDPRRSKSSLVAWIVAALAVAFALLVFFSRAGSPGNTIGGYGAIILVGIIACPIMMGAMMWMMMRMNKGH